MGINIEEYEGLVYCTRLFIQICFGVMWATTKSFQTYSVHSATLTATASPGRQRALHHTHVDEDNEAVLKAAAAAKRSSSLVVAVAHSVAAEQT